MWSYRKADYEWEINNRGIFDFDNSTITVNGHTLKVVEDSDFVYKVLKTKVKAINGIEGLYKHILEAMHVESVCNTMTWHVLCKIGNIKE